MPNSRFGYSVKKNSFKGLNIDCIQYSNIIRITYYLYSYLGTILNPNIIRIRIWPNICARILFVFVFAHSEKTNIIRIRIRSKFWFRIIFVFVFGPKNSIRSPLFLAGLHAQGHEVKRFGTFCDTIFTPERMVSFKERAERGWKSGARSLPWKSGWNPCTLATSRRWTFYIVNFMVC